MQKIEYRIQSRERKFFGGLGEAERIFWPQEKRNR
jgi:hypothetical protein